VAVHLHIDCFVGISGDMMLGALVDLGVDPVALEEGLRGLGDGFGLQVADATKAGIRATHVRVELVGSHPAHDHDEPEHPPAEDHRHSHGHDHHHHGLSYGDCVEAIGVACLAPRAQARALAILERLAQAEAAVHGVEVEKVHFHELGGVDTLVDLCGTALALEMLEVETISASPLPMAHGFIRCEHGMMPVPPPAVAKLAEGLPVRSVDIEGETVTPTGAAIVRALASSVGPMPALRVQRVGHGAGTKDFSPYPNVLRLLYAERDDAAPAHQVTEICTQIDDISAEVLAFACDRLREEGALDVLTAPVMMKKGRLATALTVLCRPDDAERMAALLLTETSSIGVRMHECRRLCLPREIRLATTPYGDVRMKVVLLPTGEERAAPEYEDCARLAREARVPILDVYRAALG
jgi:pyridinium-3,5-bisthiocarboxylic acid mononucleotide nickel chelatase